MRNLRINFNQNLSKLKYKVFLKNIKLIRNINNSSNKMMILNNLVFKRKTLLIWGKVSFEVIFLMGN